MKLRIKYLEDAVKLKKITKGNWIDGYANEEECVPLKKRKMMNLSFSME